MKIRHYKTCEEFTVHFSGIILVYDILLYLQMKQTFKNGVMYIFITKFRGSITNTGQLSTTVPI
ncbi:hypothetical protein NQ315_002813 [Exocentrus adspersus]|uniref:Uncharacterized protein n=2 Tax=Exocentrus adspersus TaxID=1586481 RepID=A0AAV8VEF8_9CUCU|nr:hypothetical protein NQ315_002813 [Exocentrus adspersus]